jgi:hypothetical protein
MDTAKILLAVPAKKLPSAALIKSSQLVCKLIGLYLTSLFLETVSQYRSWFESLTTSGIARPQITRSR